MKKLTDYFPEDTPEYMLDAWVSCLKFVTEDPGMLELFRKEEKQTEDLEVFMDWFNKTIWGAIEPLGLIPCYRR